MKSAYLAFCVAGLSMLLAGCSDAPPPPADTSAADQKAIQDGEVAWNADWASKDVDKIAGHYADDASLMIPNAPILKGKDAIRTGLKDFLADKNFALSFATVTVEASKGGDLAYTQGTYSMTMTNPKTKRAETETGKYVTVYKKQADKSWKAIEDISNDDAQAKPVATARKAVPASKKKKR